MTLPHFDLSPGWFVIIILKRPLYTNSRAWVGQVQQASALGVRITTIEWMTGLFCGPDFWFPWPDIAGIEIFTSTEEMQSVNLGAKQTRYNGPAERSDDA